MPTTILVTGATGFLGRHILAALARRPDIVTIAAARDASRLPDGFAGDVRVGDLTDPAYRRDVVRGVDVVIHAGTWSSFWGHAAAERELFLEPSIDLIDQAVAAGVSRFIAASTVALSTPAQGDALVADDEPAVRRGYWPHLDLMIDVEDYMRQRAGATQMVSLRLGHFMGAGNALGLVSAIIPRLKTLMVPWVGGGKSRLPLVSGEDMSEAFALAATSRLLGEFESINVIGSEQPTTREVFTFVAREANVPLPLYSVPLGAAFGFGALMEALDRVLPGKAPFLTRALVHVGQNWHSSDDAARALLGYVAKRDWREVVSETVAERREMGFPWPALAQPLARSEASTTAPAA